MEQNLPLKKLKEFPNRCLPTKRKNFGWNSIFIRGFRHGSRDNWGISDHLMNLGNDVVIDGRGRIKGHFQSVLSMVIKFPSCLYGVSYRQTTEQLKFHFLRLLKNDLKYFLSAAA